MKSTRLLSLATALVAVAATTGRARPDREDEARVLFEQATAALDTGDDERALALYREAYALAPRAKILLNIGAMLLKLQRYREAADTFDDYLQRPDRDPSREADIREQLRLLDARLAKLQLDVRVAPGAGITLDGTPVGTSPLVASIRVTPGPHRVRIHHDGGQYSKSFDLEIGAGGSHTLLVDREDRDPVPSGELATTHELRESRAPHGAGRGRVMVFGRADINLEGGTVVAPGIDVRLYSMWHVFANALVGAAKGAEVGGRVVIGGGRIRPVITGSVPTFYVDGITVAGRGALGVAIGLGDAVDLSIDVGVAHAPSPPMGYETTSWLGSIALGYSP